MNAENETWQTRFEAIVSQMTSEEKTKFYKAVDVNRVSVLRWRTGENTPRAHHVRRILELVPPSQREGLRTLMLRDPKVRRLLLPEGAERPPGTLSHEAYEEILRVARVSPDRFWLLATILDHLIYPPNSGIEMTVTRCVVAPSTEKVRYLFSYASRGTAPKREDLHLENRLFGIETPAGYVVQHRHHLIVPDLHSNTLPISFEEETGSVAAFPILRDGKVGGAFTAFSPQPKFFTQDLLITLEHVADLLMLVLVDFFSFESIHLELMPPKKVQDGVFATLPQRVQEAYRRELQAGGSARELQQVEAQVRHTIASELLQQATIPIKAGQE